MYLNPLRIGHWTNTHTRKLTGAEPQTDLSRVSTRPIKSSLIAKEDLCLSVGNIKQHDPIEIQG